ncbi:hypothetical protein [Microvirga sp. 2TAF3]|uniref:hypothetical protein n=1 Tax=Microvirga sp. 2TAF3 TaxID=3233014 RepID=UPI003F99A7AA
MVWIVAALESAAGADVCYLPAKRIQFRVKTEKASSEVSIVWHRAPQQSSHETMMHKGIKSRTKKEQFLRMLHFLKVSTKKEEGAAALKWLDLGASMR